MTNPPQRACNVDGCDFVTAANNSTVALVLQDLQIHMDGHKINEDRMARVNATNADQTGGASSTPRNFLQKQRPPPIYGKSMDFKDYIDLLTEWDSSNLDSAATKQLTIIESLEKTSHRSIEASYLNTNSVRLKTNRTVAFLIKVLKEKFEPTNEQLHDNFIQQVRSFKPNSKEDLLSEGEKLLAHWKELKIGDNPSYFIMRWMTNIGKENDLISATEVREIESNITATDDNEKWIAYKKNFKRVLVDSDPKVIDTNYSNRYGRKESRSSSRGRTFSKNRERTQSSPSRNPSNNSWRNRSQSNSGKKYSQEENIEYLVKSLKEMRKDIVDLKKAQKEKEEANKDDPIKTAFSFNDNIEIMYNERRVDGEFIILDSGAPVTCAGEQWFEKHLEHSNLSKEDLKSYKVNNIFGFGNGKKIKSEIAYDIPIRLKDDKGNDKETVLKTSIMESSIPLLCGKDSLKELGGIHSHVDNKLTCKNLDDSEFNLVSLSSGHDGLKLQPYKEMPKEELSTYIVETYLLSKDTGDDYPTEKKVKELFTDKELQNIHKVSNHKNADSMIEALQNSGITLKKGDRAKIEKMIDHCDVCTKFKRSLARPKVAWPKLQ